ncbi:hypothetical protein [Brevibacillus halotolerans]|nr:hypothetical protein [Brevibacillus halotolerans]
MNGLNKLVQHFYELDDRMPDLFPRTPTPLTMNSPLTYLPLLD